VLQDPSGLESALDELASLTSRLHQRQVEVFFEEGITFPNPDVSMHLYRIAQEAVSNALKHANAQGVSIPVGIVGGHLRLAVQDDGPGVPASVFASATGMGLRTMKYRASLIGAQLEIGRGPEGGTLVTCHMQASPPVSDQIQAGTPAAGDPRPGTRDSLPLRQKDVAAT
jgi:two-component system CheB/CheR fusion protein